MVTFTKTALVFMTAIAVFIQPCPAPPVWVVIGAISACTLISGGAVGGMIGMAKNLEEKNKKHQGRDLDNNSCQMDPRFSHCAGEAMQNVTIATFFGRDTHSILANGFPKECMAQIAEYNKHPDIERMRMVVLNDTAVLFHSKGPEWKAIMEELATHVE
jgi:hypothetical protein